MGRYKNPLLNPLHYATPQPFAGPPATYATAQRTTQGYDYVIVGAGAAGCVLANELSQDQNTTVLLLEAGGDNANVLESKVPILFSKLFHTEHDWDYYTVEQEALAQRRLYWPRGRMLGGSTSINAMMYQHGSKSDLDQWVSRHGCKGWGYDDLAPYFRRMEKFTPNPARPAVNTQHRGDSGLWQTGYSHLSEIGDKGFIPACNDVGIPSKSDINTPGGPLGVTRFQTFIDPKGQRCSLATAYLSPEVQQRPNLYVACNARVTRVLFDHLTYKEPTVIGVEFQTSRGGDLFQVHARKEVILSAGSVNTPQTLLLSGIGPADELKKHRIPVVHENDAVGRNLKDHLTATGIICKAKEGTTLDYLASTIKALPALARWMVTGGGPLTSNAGEAAAFIRSFEHHFPSHSPPKDNTSGDAGPDVEIIGAPMAYIHHGEEPVADGAGAFTFGAIGLRPQSSGAVTLQSRNVFDAPIIDPRYLTDEANNDRAVLLTGLRVCLRIMQSPALRKYLEPVPVNDDPGSYWWPYSSSNVDAITDEQLNRFMQEKAFTLYHPIGTARMGPTRDSSVVDLECRVRGVKGLRVMDASVIPEQLSGHPTATIGAMAMRLGEAIREGQGAGRVAANL